MNMQQAASLVKNLVTQVSNWQRSADKGRTAKTSMAASRKAVKRLLSEISGEEPDEATVSKVFDEVGLI